MFKLLKRKVLPFAERIKTASIYRHPLLQIYDLAIHKIITNTSPRDYYEFRFYRPGLSWEEKSRFIGKRGSRYWPYENNQLKFTTTLTDKYIQKALLLGFDLPTSPLITTIGEFREVRTRDSLLGFFQSEQRDLVLKPISSTAGKDILVLNRRGDTWYQDSQIYPFDSIWEMAWRQWQRGMLVEERMLNDRQIRDIYPGCLNTYRFQMIRTEDLQWHLAGAFLRLGAHGRVVDNTGSDGIVVLINDYGTTSRAVDFGKASDIEKHPNTGQPLLNLQLKGYSAARDLAFLAVERFGYLGTIGWDIASTEKGPVIIEGNTVWGPEIFQIASGYGVITDELATGLRRRNFLTRWNRDCIHP